MGDTGEDATVKKEVILLQAEDVERQRRWLTQCNRATMLEGSKTAIAVPQDLHSNRCKKFKA